MDKSTFSKGFSSNEGFSLKELLVVLVIIFILTSVISAFFVRYIEKTNEQTDVYNMKIVQREAEASYLLGQMSSETEYFFDSATGGIVSSVPFEGYGKGTSRNGGVYYDNYIPSMNVVDDFLCARVGANGVVVYWKNYRPSNGEEVTD